MNGGRERAARVRRVTIANERGLHARAAAKFVKIVESFEAEVTVVKDGTEVPGSSLMGLMMLAAGPGSVLELRAEGPDGRVVLDALQKLVAEKFHEG